MSRYKQYTKRQFEYLLNGVLIKHRLGFLSEVDHKDAWEYVYEITTKNRAITIIVFSSIDKRTGKTRNNGDDRVRLVLRWQTRYGDRFMRLARHNRITTLFDNVKGTLLNANVFNLKSKDFSSTLPF